MVRKDFFFPVVIQFISGQQFVIDVLIVHYIIRFMLDCNYIAIQGIVPLFHMLHIVLVNFKVDQSNAK